MSVPCCNSERAHHEYRRTSSSLLRVVTSSRNRNSQGIVDLSVSGRLESIKRLVAMTNSAPKMSDKVERHGSPNNSGGKRQSNRSASIKTTTYFSNTPNSGRNNNSNNNINNCNSSSSSSSATTAAASRNGRASCSPPCNARTARNSPAKSIDQQSPRGSPTSSFYAGAKFSEPPSPASLPKPPSHWTTRLMTSCKQSETCCNISNHLKMILNVQA